VLVDTDLRLASDLSAARPVGWTWRLPGLAGILASPPQSKPEPTFRSGAGWLRASDCPKSGSGYGAVSFATMIALAPTGVT